MSLRTPRGSSSIARENGSKHRRLSRYSTLTLPEICALPVAEFAAPTSRLYLWVPNALLPDGLSVMKLWGYEYKSNIIWHKIRKDGGGR